MVITPPIITTVKTTTKVRNSLSEVGSSNSSVSSDIFTFLIGPEPPGRLDKALARDVPAAAHLSRSRLTRLLAEGAVRINGTVIFDAKARVNEADCVEIRVPSAVDVDILPEPIPIKIVYEDDDLVIVDKPAGLVVHPAPGTPSGTLVNALLHHFGGALSGVGGEKRPGIVHRIDKDTSGLLVVAKSDAAHHGLAAQFEAHSVHRHYRALCYGCPDPADPRLRGVTGVSWEPGGVVRVATELARHRSDRQRQAVVASGGRRAVTRAKVIEEFGAASLLDCWLETGRTHQIRVHITHMGHGLIGDPIYGGRRKLPKGQPGADVATAFPRQALHAAELGFEHPTQGKNLCFQSEIPPDMVELMTALRG